MTRPHRHKRKNWFSRLSPVLRYVGYALVALAVLGLSRLIGIPTDWVIAFCLGVLAVLLPLLWWADRFPR